MEAKIGELFRLACEVRLRAHAPYSQFQVGAALLGRNGKIFTGCNVENISFGLTCCAERVAVFSALAAGNSMFEIIVIVADTEIPVSPCGACRQVLAEFSPEMTIFSMNLKGTCYRDTLTNLLPRAREGILNQ